MVGVFIRERKNRKEPEGNAPVSPSTPSEGKGVVQEGVAVPAVPVASTVVPMEFKGEDNRKINWKG